jgi:CRP/FNR family transcriptional regulator
MDGNEKRLFLKSVIKHIHKEIHPESLEYFVNDTTEKSLPKNTIFIPTTGVHKEIGFVAKGLLRGFYIDEEANEINTRFVSEGNFATHYKAFISQEPSKYCFKTIESCELLCFNYNHLQEGYRLFPDLEKFGRLMAEAIICRMDNRLESQQFDSAEKRYHDFVKEYADLHNRLSLEQIASYLRVTRPALSRIRSRKL